MEGGYRYFLDQLRQLPSPGDKEPWIMDKFETTSSVKNEIDEASDRAYIEWFCMKPLEGKGDPSAVKDFVYAIVDGNRRFYFSAPPNFMLDRISEKGQLTLEVYNLRDKADEARLDETITGLWTIDDYQRFVQHLLYKKMAKVTDPDTFMQACVERHGPILLKRTQ